MSMQLSSNIKSKIGIALLLILIVALAAVFLRSGDEEASEGLRVSGAEAEAVRSALQNSAPTLSETDEERVRKELQKPPESAPTGGGTTAAPSLSDEEIEKIRQELRK